VHCKKYPYIHGYFMARFPWSTGPHLWTWASLFRRLTDASLTRNRFRYNTENSPQNIRGYTDIFLQRALHEDANRPSKNRPNRMKTGERNLLLRRLIAGSIWFMPVERSDKKYTKIEISGVRVAQKRRKTQQHGVCIVNWRQLTLLVIAIHTKCSRIITISLRRQFFAHWHISGWIMQRCDCILAYNGKI